MNKSRVRSLLLFPLAVAAVGVSVVAFHPGRAYAEPRLASTGSTPLADDATFAIDPAHSSLSFEVVHLGLSHVHGRISKFSGTVKENADLTKASVEVTGQMATIDTAVGARDNHLRTADYFEVEKYPTFTFKSTKVEKTKDGYAVTGDLTIKDKTKKLTIPFKHYGPVSVQGQPTKIGIVGDPVVIKRSDFGVGTVQKMPNGSLALSDEVTIRLSFEGNATKPANE